MRQISILSIKLNQFHKTNYAVVCDYDHSLHLFFYNQSTSYQWTGTTPFKIAYKPNKLYAFYTAQNKIQNTFSVC